LRFFRAGHTVRETAKEEGGGGSGEVQRKDNDTRTRAHTMPTRTMT
jgi:hypothetical protein